MKHNNKTIIAGLIAGLFAAPIHADEQRCEDNRYCTPLAQPGNSLMNSRVLTRPLGDTPPSAEYRQPDEVVVIGADAGQDSVVYDEQHISESKAQNEQAGDINYESGENFLSAAERTQLLALAQRLSGKANLRMAIIGHADEQHLSARKRAIYGDNVGLSNARAKEAAAFLNSQSGLANVTIETSGNGDSAPLVQCDKNTPMRAYQACLAPNRRVEIQVWYDQVTERVEQVARTVTTPPPAPVECSKATGTDTGLPFRISVDGEPLVDTDKPNTADATRCTDVALDHADIQVRYDALEETPWLNLTVFPNAAVRSQPVRFTSYSNYQHWITHGEVRLFADGNSTQSTPLDILPLDEHGQAEWTPDFKAGANVRYVLRVYDQHGKFDETAPQPLPIAEKPDLLERDTAKHEALIGYGENRLSLHNIPVRGGAATANGTQLQPGQTVRFMGQ